MLVMASLLMADDLYEMDQALNGGSGPRPATPTRRRSSAGGSASWQSAPRTLPLAWSIPRVVRAELPGASGNTSPGPVSNSLGSWLCRDLGLGIWRPPAQAGSGRMTRQRPWRLRTHLADLIEAKRAVRERALAARAAWDPGGRRGAGRHMCCAMPARRRARWSPASGRSGRRSTSARCCMRCTQRGHPIVLPETPKARQSVDLSALAPGRCAGRRALRHDAARSARCARRTILLVPLLAFDRRGNRLGYGAGYYDRTLAALPGRVSPGRGLRGAGTGRSARLVLTTRDSTPSRPSAA